MHVELLGYPPVTADGRGLFKLAAPVQGLGKSHRRMRSQSAEVIIVGGGLAGLSAAIYLGRAKRETLLIDAGKSMARWEPEVQNFLGFPDGIDGAELLRRGRLQAQRYHTRFRRDRIVSARCHPGGLGFALKGSQGRYSCHRLLLATGIFHIPPDIPEVEPCLGHSLFFCKDCDGYRVQGKTIAVYGWTDEAVQYALGMLLYSSCVFVVTDGREPSWSPRHGGWIRTYEVPVYTQTIANVLRRGHAVRGLVLGDGIEVKLDGLFTTRGDHYVNHLAKALGARLNSRGEIAVDAGMRTTVHGLYAAGCVTPANCQMIIAAGQGAAAAQAINRDLFEQSLANHTLRRFRQRQLRTRRTRPRGRATR